MKRGGLALTVTIFLAVAAAAAVFLYVSNVRQHAQTGGGTVSVLVSKQDIPANTDLDPLIADGVFRSETVSRDDLVQGAVTDVYQLRGQRTAYPILAGEQIAVARLQGKLQAAGGVLGIPEGHEAITVSLDASRAVASALTQGDDVTIFASFDNVPVTELKAKSVTVTQTSASAQGVRATVSATQTVVLVPQVGVLEVSGAGTTSSSAQQVQQGNGDVSVTLALLPQDAQKLVFAMDQGTVWLGLLPPNATGKHFTPVSFAQVLR
jgi:pilus assembly protein CpaB